MDICGSVGRLIASDRGGRKVSSLFRSGFLDEAGKLLEGASRVAVVTGFFVPACGSPETDGPGGAVALGRSVEKSGREAALFTDRLCLEAVKACSASVGGPAVLEAAGAEEILAFGPDLIVFIERLGRAEDGRYYNMRAEDVTATTAPLDEAALSGNGLKVLAVGDGGNEAGMGLFRRELAELLPGYASCLSVVEADAALPVDVSDWGGYALASLLSVGCGEWIGPEEDETGCMLDALISAGAVDGVTRRREPTVDGFPEGEHKHVIRELKELVTSRLRNFGKELA
ncbi:DUF4392 domain-containing protein [Aminivibrio sp.]|jgi:hypothetical protein|uniref:DUF4392 domain-containing protein n=1 Tax=Aminivibrio sp. TaxID=1872489 RepID=UPI0025BE1D10|nr:DUF4392 domain-containing protein [Aminivibrio sp.]